MSGFQRASVDRFLDRARAINSSAVDRLLASVKKNPVSGCWELQRLISAGGYGAIRVDGKKHRAHRWLYEALYGSIGSLEVRHLCHKPGCIFPGHLRPGTHRENMLDRKRARRGGDLRGEKNGRAVLTNAQVRAIRSSKEPGTVLAARHGVSKVMVSRIRLYKAWRHVS